MQERQVTTEDRTRVLERPFLVLATQNPIEYEGTYPLPEAQLDRFLIRMRVGYPVRRRRVAASSSGASNDETTRPSCAPVIDRDELVAMQRAVENVHLSESIGRYIVAVVAATRESPSVQVGASPRGTLALMKLGRVNALLDGRDFVVPDDIKAVAVPALAHRLALRPELWVQRVQAEDVVRDCLNSVPVPDDHVDELTRAEAHAIEARVDAGAHPPRARGVPRGGDGVAVLPRLPASRPPEAARRSDEVRRPAPVGQAARAALPGTEARLRADLDRGARPRRPRGVSARLAVLAEPTRVRGGWPQAAARRDPSAGRTGALGRRVRAAAAEPEIRLEARLDRRTDRNRTAQRCSMDATTWPTRREFERLGSFGPRDGCLPPRRDGLLGSPARVQGATPRGHGPTAPWTDERIRAELEEFCRGRTTWPNEREFLAAGKSKLYTAACHYGGTSSLGRRAWARPHEAIWASARFAADHVERIAGGRPMRLRRRRQRHSNGASRLPSRRGRAASAGERGDELASAGPCQRNLPVVPGGAQGRPRVHLALLRRAEQRHGRSRGSPPGIRVLRRAHRDAPPHRRGGHEDDAEHQRPVRRRVHWHRRAAAGAVPRRAVRTGTVPGMCQPRRISAPERRVPARPAGDDPRVPEHVRVLPRSVLPPFQARLAAGSYARRSRAAVVGAAGRGRLTAPRARASTCASTTTSTGTKPRARSGTRGSARSS